MLCRTITASEDGVVRKCSTRLVSGVIKFQLDSDDIVTVVSRANVVVATGVEVTLGHGRMQLMLTSRRPMRRGRYTLTLRSHRHGRSITRRETITVT